MIATKTKSPRRGIFSFFDFLRSSSFLAVLAAGLHSFVGRDSAEGLRGGFGSCGGSVSSPISGYICLVIQPLALRTNQTYSRLMLLKRDVAVNTIHLVLSFKRLEKLAVLIR